MEKMNVNERLTLGEKLEQYSKSDFYPFHMPGHKRNRDFMELPPVWAMDITEIEGFDNLHHAGGILQQAQERAAALYGAERTFYLINGSTCGLIAAIAAVTRRGDQVLVARNCHKAVYHGIELHGLKPVYIYPRFSQEYGIFGDTPPELVRQALKEYPGIKAIILTSPTFEGVKSDLRAIVKIAHAANVCLIVDEAHGAHLKFHKTFGVTALEAGADLVINSIHKTLPAMTMTALLHVGRHEGRVDEHRLAKYLAMYQTSSPSYVMMASIDQCVKLLETQAEPMFEAYMDRLIWLRKRLKTLKVIRLLDGEDLCAGRADLYDRSKLVLYIGQNLGKALYESLLDEWHLQLEMASADYALAMTSICDTDEGIERLYKALKRVDEAMEVQEPEEAPFVWPEFKGLYMPVMSSDAAQAYETLQVKLADAIGACSGEYAYIYPPGVPLLVPGERITQEMVDLLKHYRKAGFDIMGLKDSKAKWIEILKTGDLT